MIRFNVVPLVGVGTVYFGMSRQEARNALGVPVLSFQKGPSSTALVDAFLENAFQIFYDEDDTVEYIELSRGGPFTALYQNVPVFETKAEELLEIVSRDTSYDRNRPEQGYTFIFPMIEVSLWRQSLPEDEEDYEEETDEEYEKLGTYFDTIGVGASGYYSLETP
jgi:hypothetical protein